MAHHIEPVLHARRIDLYGYATVEVRPARLQTGRGCGGQLLGPQSLHDTPYLDALVLDCQCSDSDGRIICYGVRYRTPYHVGLGEAQRMARTLQGALKAFARHSVADFGDQARAMAAWLQCRSFVFLDEAGRLDVTDIATGIHTLRSMLRRLEDETKARLSLRSAA